MNMASSPFVRSAGNSSSETHRCQSCWSTKMHVDWAAGDRICTNCGVIDDEHLLEERPEWREYDNVDEAPRAPARCGMVPNNEDKWVGGLQPTTLSKYIFGGSTAHSSSIRKTLLKMNHITQASIEKRHASQLKDAQLTRQILRKRRLRDGYTDDDDDTNTDVHPRYEDLLVQEEENGLAHTGALYADKWSLNRSISLFGTPAEQAAVTSDEAETIEDIRNNLDSVLSVASQQLYSAYATLMKTGQRLGLPDSVLNEAANHLSGYAARKDGLTVRGVSSQLKQNTSKKASLVSHRQAQTALQEYNQFKQHSALVAALLFLTARRKDHLRPIADVCRAVPCESFKKNPHLEWTKGEPLLKLKHCSKAMAAVKQVFPDLARNPVSLENADDNATLKSKGEGGNEIDAISLQNYVTHTTSTLRLPPVAEACLQILMKRLTGPEKLALRTASLTFFLGLTGNTMQKLANQSSNRKRPRRVPAFIMPRIPKKEKKSGLKVVESERERSNGTPATQVKSETEDTQVKSETEDATDDMDIFGGDSTLTSFAAEERAYEMQRVWNAWKDQTPWWRSPAEIAQATQIPIHQIKDHYKRKIHPQRQTLLEALAQASNDHTPLSSVLLPHIALAAPLIKEF